MRRHAAIAILLGLAALALSACAAVNCGAHGNNRDSGGGCRAHTTF